MEGITRLLLYASFPARPTFKHTASSSQQSLPRPSNPPYPGGQGMWEGGGYRTGLDRIPACITVSVVDHTPCQSTPFVEKRRKFKVRRENLFEATSVSFRYATQRRAHWHNNINLGRPRSSVALVPPSSLVFPSENPWAARNRSFRQILCFL